MTTTNQQVKLLMKMLKKHTQITAAAKAGMDVKTAGKYIKSGQLPSDQASPHNWKTRPDAFEEDWPMLEEMLNNAPGLQGKTLMEYLVRIRPDQYKPDQLRTLQRRIRDWRASHGAGQAIIFNQDIPPGKQSQSDFTCQNDLKVTINGRPFKHLLFHWMLPYSRWESIRVCLSESFDNLVLGIEKAVWELGYIALEHRTDNLTAAT
ncbi:MAG: transposase family protein [Gammaproteobacteria bacterium]|nr:transposase family protein [Gammaproteobacteria bacterium]